MGIRHIYGVDIYKLVQCGAAPHSSLDLMDIYRIVWLWGKYVVSYIHRVSFNSNYLSWHHPYSKVGLGRFASLNTVYTYITY